MSHSQIELAVSKFWASHETVDAPELTDCHVTGGFAKYLPFLEQRDGTRAITFTKIPTARPSFGQHGVAQRAYEMSSLSYVEGLLADSLCLGSDVARPSGRRSVAARAIRGRPDADDE